MTRYSRGAALERETRKKFEGEGYYAIRSAGSRGQCDLIAIDPSGLCYFVQCKRGKITPAERKSLYELAQQFKSVAIIAYKDSTSQLGIDEAGLVCEFPFNHCLVYD